MKSFCEKEQRIEHRQYDRDGHVTERHERSCGAIVFRFINGARHVLVVQHGVGHWSFPKGHVEPGETDHETAIREVKEETGIDISITQDFSRESTYAPRPGVSKTVVFFLGNYLGGILRPQPEEVKCVSWMTPDECKGFLIFDRDREIFEDALRYVSELESRGTEE